MNPTESIKSLDDDEKMTLRNSEGHSGQRGGAQMLNVISEAGLYTLLLRSNKEEAKPFRRWVTHEVLPTLRKTGSYTIERPSYAIEDSIERAKAWIKEEEERRALKSENEELTETVAVREQQIAELQPKASYYDVVLACVDLLLITVIAKDYGWSAKRMNEWLREQKVQYRVNETWILYQQHAERGYTKTKTHVYTDVDGLEHTKVHTYWTQAGRLFLYELMKTSGNLPLMEK